MLSLLISTVEISIYMSSVYYRYVRDLRNLFPSAPIPLPSSQIPQSQPVDTSAAIAVAMEKAFEMRYKIINTIIARNRW
jgi:hypothetical protein